MSAAPQMISMEPNLKTAFKTKPFLLPFFSDLSCSFWYVIQDKLEYLQKKLGR